MSIWPSSPCPSAKAQFTCLKPKETHFGDLHLPVMLPGECTVLMAELGVVARAAGSRVWGPRRLKPQALSPLFLPCNPRSFKWPRIP